MCINSQESAPFLRDGLVLAQFTCRALSSSQVEIHPVSIHLIESQGDIAYTYMLSMPILLKFNGGSNLRQIDSKSLTILTIIYANTK